MKDTLMKLVECMYSLQEECRKIIVKAYGQDRKIELPVDIKRIADNLEIQICRAPLNYGGGKKIDQNIAQLRYDMVDGKVIKKIVLDDEIQGSVDDADDLSDLERYAIAYEIGKTLIEEQDTPNMDNIVSLNFFSVPYSLPRLSAQLENFTYEMCAIFLLLPMRQFMDEFSDYTNEIQEHPVLMDRWIRHLSMRAEIPNYQLVNGYQYIKLCAYQYYVDKLQKIDEEVDEEEKVRLLRHRELYQ